MSLPKILDWRPPALIGAALVVIAAAVFVVHATTHWPQTARHRHPTRPAVSPHPRHHAAHAAPPPTIARPTPIPAPSPTHHRPHPRTTHHPAPSPSPTSPRPTPTSTCLPVLPLCLALPLA